MGFDEELVKQTRSLHLALVASSFVILVATALGGDISMDAAIDELNEVRFLEENVERPAVLEAWRIEDQSHSEGLTITEIQRALLWIVGGEVHEITEPESNYCLGPNNCITTQTNRRTWIPVDGRAVPLVDLEAPRDTLNTLRTMQRVYDHLVAGERAVVIDSLYPELASFSLEPMTMRYAVYQPPVASVHYDRALSDMGLGDLNHGKAVPVPS